MNLTMQLALFVLLAVILFAVWMYRKWLDDHEDHNIHLHNTASDTNVIVTQQSINKRLEVLERAIRYLTIVLIAYGLIVAALAIYNGWDTSNAVIR
jgi:hypothetical protein